MSENNNINDVLEALKLILNFKLIKNKKNDNMSINDVLGKVDNNLEGLAELSEDALSKIENRADLMLLMDNITNNLDKNNRALLDIISQILGIIKTLLRNEKGSDGSIDDVFKDLKQNIENSFEEKMEEENLYKSIKN